MARGASLQGGCANNDYSSLSPAPLLESPRVHLKDFLSITTEEKVRRASLLQAEADEAREKEAEREKRLKEVNSFWEAKVNVIEEEIEDLNKSIQEHEAALELLLNPPDALDKGPPPPGPKWLRFLDGNAFMFVASIVIVSNIVTMVMEMLHKHYVKDFFWIDQFFMMFYIFELSSKALLMQRGLLFGKLAIVWWNWLDLIIVVSGCLDMYVKPLLMMTGVLQQKKDKGPSLLSLLRMLRMARLARILKIVNVFLKSDLSWTEGDRFQTFIMSVIGFNSILMGFEADIPDFVGWYYVEQSLLIIFSFELLVRLRFAGCKFFYGSNIVWNWLDFIIVAGGIMDQWMMPAISIVQELMGMPTQTSGNMSQIMTMLRMARLLRILRLVRLVKNIPPLFDLVTGIVQAMQGMGWVLLLTLVVLYSFALLGVRLIGHGLVFGGEPPDAASVFPTVFESMFVLFKVMNADMSPLEDLFIVLPVMKAVATSFMVLSSWAILSILTAVVSENMINACETNRDENGSEENQLRLKETREKLEIIFESVDTDASGMLSKEEFDKMLEDEEQAAELCEAAGLTKSDLRTLFSYLAPPQLGGDGENGDEVNGGHGESQPAQISHDRFINGLQTESRPVSERSIMRMEKRLKMMQDMAMQAHAQKRGRAEFK